MTRPATITARVAAMAFLLAALAQGRAPRRARPRARHTDAIGCGWQPADPELAWERRRLLA